MCHFRVLLIFFPTEQDNLILKKVGLRRWTRRNCSNPIFKGYLRNKNEGFSLDYSMDMRWNNWSLRKGGISRGSWPSGKEAKWHEKVKSNEERVLTSERPRCEFQFFGPGALQGRDGVCPFQCDAPSFSAGWNLGEQTHRISWKDKLSFSRNEV